MSLMNRRIVLASRPTGNPREEDFRLVETPLRDIRDGELLIRNLHISLDAGFRNWMDEGSGDNVLPAMEIDAPVMGLTLGRVEASQHSDYPVGSLLMARLAWEEYSITDAHDFLNRLPDDPPLPLRYYLGVLGDTGLSAYFGLHDVGQPKAGETILVSAAAGAVGSVAGQIARIMGARTVGITSSRDKCTRLIDDLGYDEAINRNAADISAEIARACPDGVDVYFDNVGGPLLERVLDQINPCARIVLCGSVATYGATESVPGPANLFQLVTKEAIMQGFMCHFREARYAEGRAALSGWINSGQLKVFEHRFQGIEHVARAFCDLFAGQNFGKTIVTLSNV